MFIIEAGPVKRISLYTSRVKGNRYKGADKKESAVWLVWVGADPKAAKLYAASNVVCDGPFTTGYANKDADILEAVANGEVFCVEAFIETTMAVKFTQDDEADPARMKPYADARELRKDS